jgi:Ni,Fe-hydrogenase III large subunit
MSRFDWLSELIARCEEEHILLCGGSASVLPPAHVLSLDVEDWGRFAGIACDLSLRWCSIWALQKDDNTLLLNACFEKHGDYLVIRAQLEIRSPVLASHTPFYPAANRPERQIQDMYGVLFSDHPDSRRWIRHQAWPEGVYPLRKNFSVNIDDDSKKTPADSDYPFFQAQGAAVYEIPVGPIHAGMIEPGHFRFQAVGELVLNLEERLGYVHRGIEKIAEGRDAAGLAKLAARISGDTTVAHTWAACMAMERAAKITVPKRANFIRALLAERERIANHLGDIGAICNDVGFVFAHMQFSRLREIWQRTNLNIFNHRMLMDCIIPGGVNVDISAEQIETLKQQYDWLQQELHELMMIINDHPSLEDRILGTGVLSPEMAKKLGVVGYLGKASGIDFDLRRDHGYEPYDLIEVPSPCFQTGDVAARLQIRADEINNAISMMTALLQQMPDGKINHEWKLPKDKAEGIAMVEGWRGEIISYVSFDDNGNIFRFFARDPSWLNWPALEQLIHGNIVPDFPVCNKSVNGSYSGHDL